MARKAPLIEDERPAHFGHDVLFAEAGFDVPQWFAPEPVSLPLPGISSLKGTHSTRRAVEQNAAPSCHQKNESPIGEAWFENAPPKK